jgi:acetolactate synthase-1/2/3 large subunit
MVRVADYIMEKVYAEGANHIFTVTGRGALFLSDAVAKLKVLNSVSVHHEQAAAFAAVAYAQYTNELGACLVSTGCAGTNTLTGVLSAWQDGVPVIFISGQNSLKETSRFTGIPLRTYGQQEADIIPIVESITKYAVMITDPKMVVYEVEKALFLAKSGRKGPVWIDVPLDIQSMRIEPDELEHFIIPTDENFIPSNEDIEFVIQQIKSSSRPIVMIGNGVHSSNATDELALLLKNCPIPLVYAASAPDLYGSDNELSIGSIGSMGCSRAGNFAVQNSDLLLVLGNRLSTMTTGSDYCKFAREAKVVVVDIDKIEHSKNTVKIDRLILADLKLFLESLNKEVLEVNFNDWIKKCLHWKTIFPKCEEKYKNNDVVDLYHLADSFSKNLLSNSVFVSDSGFNELILPTNIRFKEGMRCIHPASQGAMGYALPAAIGAYFASNAPVVTTIGDGSVMMNLQELQTIRHHNIPIKLFIVNNNAYAIIRKRQVELFRSRTIGTDPSNGVSCPNFEEVAACFGLKYVKIENGIDLDNNIESVLNMEGAILCEVMGLENQEYIEISHVRNLEGKFVRRPLEDLAPFIDRELFLSEMVINPIDQ